MNSTLKNVALAVLGIILTAGAVPAHATGKGNPTGGKFAKQHPRRNQVNKRVDNQRARINKQEKAGNLTKQQADQLKANDKAIKQQEHAEVKANGGHLTKGEQKQLNKEENANSKMIHDEAHPAGQ